MAINIIFVPFENANSLCFKTFYIQTFEIIFDIQDITLCLKQNYAFRHLGYSYLSLDMRDVKTW